MDPTDARIVYGESQDGRMSRIDRNTNERTNVRPEPPEQKPGDTSGLYRFNWDTAMQLSPFDSATIYIGANMVLKSADRGRSYQPISPDLTTNTDREALAIMGVPGKDIKIAKHDGVTSFGNIVTLEESAAKAGIVWVGSDDGIVSVTQDAGANWTNVTSKIPGVPKFTLRVRRRALSCGGGHRVRDVRRPSRRRLCHLRVRDHGHRQHLAVDREQPAEGRSGARPSPRTARTRICSTWAPKPGSTCRGTRAASGRG